MAKNITMSTPLDDRVGYKRRDIFNPKEVFYDYKSLKPGETSRHWIEMGHICIQLHYTGNYYLEVWSGDEIGYVEEVNSWFKDKEK